MTGSPQTDRKRIMLCVEVDLDPIPGQADSPESWQRYLQSLLGRTAQAYNPSVEWIGWA